MFLFSLPLFPLMQPPPSTRIGYRKTKLLYLFSHGKPARAKLICSCTMALLILSSSPHSFSRSPVPFFSLSSSLFWAAWRSQSKCNERGRGKRWRQKIIWVLSDESKRNPHGWAGNRHGLAATSFTLSSRIIAIYQSAQKTVSSLHKLACRWGDASRQTCS